MKKIAIIRLDAFGDAILTSGFTRACREYWPAAEITMICSEKTHAFWQRCPFVNRVVAVAIRTSRDWAPPKIDDFFDLVLNPRPAPDYFGAEQVAAALQTSKHVAFSNDNFPLGEPAWRSPFRLLRSLDYTGPEHLPSLWYPDSYRHDHAAKYIAIGLGAGRPYKIWAPMNFAAVATALNRPTILIGGRDVNKAATEYKLNSSIECMDLTGRTSIWDTAAVLTKCALFIGNDSAPKHIAAATGTPVVEVSWINCDDSRLDFDRGFEPVGVPFKVVKAPRKFTIEETLNGEAVASVTVESVIDAAKALIE